MPESLEARAYLSIKSDIVSAKLSPGVLLSENEISTKLGISRTPVHSAIVRLENEGLLESLPKRGFIVKEVSFIEFLDMHETIVSMEFYALAKTAQHTTLDMQELKTSLDMQRAALEIGDNLAYYEAGFRFAAALVSSTGNDVMLDTLGKFRDKMLCKVLNFRKAHQDHKPKLLRNRNERVYEALAAGDVGEAQAELLRTMVNVRDFLYGWV